MVSSQFGGWSFQSLVTYEHKDQTDLATSVLRKPVINTNLPPVLHRFQVMADYWSDFR